VTKKSDVAPTKSISNAANNQAVIWTIWLQAERELERGALSRAGGLAKGSATSADIGQKVAAGYRAAPSASDRWMDPRRARYLAPVKGADGHSQENLLTSYGCRGRVAQLGEHLLCKHAFISPKSLNQRLLTMQTPVLVGPLIGLHRISLLCCGFRKF